MKKNSFFINNLILTVFLTFIVGVNILTAGNDSEKELNVSVVFTVIVPANTPAGDTVFVVGTMNNWDPGSGYGSSSNDLPMNKISAYQWQLTLSLSPNNSYEYKYTRGSWNSVEKDEQGAEITNREINIPFYDIAINDTVATWRDIINPATPENVDPVVTIYNDSAQTSVAITWASDVNGLNLIHYGINDISENQIVVEENRDMLAEYDSLIHIARLTGLQPNTTHFYQVETQGIYKSDTLAFTTASPQDSAFMFITFGDNQPAVNTTILNRIIQENPAFVLHTGDLVQDGNQLNQWFDVLADHQSLTSTTPMMPVYGNHEENSLYLTRFFALPENGSSVDNQGHWYSFDYNNVHIIGLDIYQDFTPGSEQQNWLMNDLQSISEEISFNIVFFHEPPYSSGKHGGNLEVLQYLLPIFEEYGVDLVFCGHNHLYERSIINGIPYIIAAGAGATLYEPYPGVNPYSVYAESVFHYCKIYVNGEKLWVEMIREDGSVGDVHLPLQVDGVDSDWDSWGITPIQDTDNLQTDAELKLERVFITQDADFFYFGFDAPASTKGISYGMYIDIDKIPGSGGTTDCWDKAIAAVSQHLPEIAIYAYHNNDDTWSTGSPKFYNWDQANSQWISASGGMGSLPPGGIFAIDSANRFFELAIPKNALGFNGADSFFVELFTVGETTGAGASESIPSDSTIQFTVENNSTDITILTEFYGYNISEETQPDSSTIRIDGNPSDWLSMGIEPLAVDTDSAQLDPEYQLDSLFVYMDSVNVFFGFATSCQTIGLHYGIYIDTDNVTGSGGTSDKWECDVTAVSEHLPDVTIYAYHKDTGGWSGSSPKYYTWSGSEWEQHVGGFGSLPTGGEFAHDANKDFVEIKVPRSAPGLNGVNNFYISLFNFGSEKKVCETVPSDPAIRFNGENTTSSVQLSNFAYFQTQPVSMEPDKTYQVVIDFELKQNYPNPFNPNTTILYQIPKSALVKLTIYNIAGQLVETLVNEHKTAGSYSVQWNAGTASSGLYFYRISAGEYSAVKKCLILK